MDPNDLEPLPARIFQLLLKNVSPDDPLSDGELEVRGEFVVLFLFVTLTVYSQYLTRN